MAKICSFILSALLFGSLQLTALVKHAPTLDVVIEELQGVRVGDLVVFDVDETLIVSQDQILTYAGREHFRKLKEEKLRILGKERGEFLGSILLSERKVRLVDDRVLSLIEMLKEQGVKVIALTAMRPGSSGVIESMEEWRINELKSLGLDFDAAFQGPRITLGEFENKGSSPVFENGIIFSGNYPKGEVLNAFLKRVNWSPKRVFFIDDRIDYIQSMESELEKEGIEHVSFHYTATCDESMSLDHKLANLQFDHLVENETWLNDEAARILYEEKR